MRTYSLSHLSDHALLRRLTKLVRLEHRITAAMLAHIAEVDVRKLYLPAGYPSMHAYCVQRLRLSEDAALKRIQAARVARQFPVIFTALEEGRLHLSAVCLLAPYLKEASAGDLLAAAMDRSKDEIARLIAERFPRTELLELVEELPSSARTLERDRIESNRPDEYAPAHVTASPAQHAPGHVATPVLSSKLQPHADGRYALHVVLCQEAHDLIRYAQVLSSHSNPQGNISQVLLHALRDHVAQLEKRKFATTSRPRPQRPSRDPRHIPAHVKRAVWERDGGQCTFVSDSGQRCPARARLEFDHADPVARGGETTVENIRLRCRAHNQYVAERVFGEEFMNEKREAAKTRAQAAKQDPEKDVVPWLRRLGFRVDEARQAAAHCESMAHATLEDRVRAALAYLRPGTPSRHACPASEVAA